MIFCLLPGANILVIRSVGFRIFSVGAGGAIQTTLFQCFCLELKSIFTAQNFIHIFGILLLPNVICKSHIDTS